MIIRQCVDMRNSSIQEERIAYDKTSESLYTDLTCSGKPTEADLVEHTRDQSNSLNFYNEYGFFCRAGTNIPLPVAALRQGAPGQMTWLEDPPPWLRPAYCFASVIV